MIKVDHWELQNIGQEKVLQKYIALPLLQIYENITL